MHRFSASRRAVLALVLSVLWTAPAAAQRIPIASATGSGTLGTISTGGADCSVATNCVSFSTDDVPSFGIDLDVGTSGTFNFEILVNADGGTAWRSWPDANGNTSATADGYYTFSNTGFRRFRVRANAGISGAATVSASKGYVALRSTATLSGSISGNAAASATGAAVPANSDFIGVDVGGTLRGVTGFGVGSQFAQATAIVDGGGNQITSFGGGTQYANAAVQATPTGTTALGWDGTAVRALSTSTSGQLNLNNISGTISLPSGAATAANQATANASLAIIDNVVFGAGTEAAALRVTLPTDGTGVVGLTGSAAQDIADSRGYLLTMSGDISFIKNNLSTDGDFSVTTLTRGPQIMCNGSTATPAGVNADQEAVQFWCDRIGRLQINTAMIGGVAPNMGDGPINTGTQRITIAIDDIVSDAATLFAANLVAHDAVDAGSPLKVGGRAVSFGATPTAVAAADRVDFLGTRAGIPFTQPGHPNMIPFECQVEDADGAQTNAACVSVSAGTKIVVTGVSAHCDASNTGPINVIVGFGTATLPARSHTGATGILLAVDGIIAGGGDNKGYAGGIIGTGADDEDIRFTMEDPAGGACSVEGSYYTIAG